MSAFARYIDQGLILTDIPVLPVAPILQCMQDFMSSEDSHRLHFLQKEYGFAFDGYSHCGQVDSTHQAAEDLLHTFVLSDFYPAERYPVAFQSFILQQWPELVSQLRNLELSMIETLPVELRTWYQHSAGHMLSANYYPSLSQFNTAAHGDTRLSAHPDVSLFTVFPFGLDSAFQYETPQGQWLSAPETDRMIAFPGYLLEWLSNGKVKALNHRVRLDSDQARERYSFAVFSIPARDTSVSRVVGPSGAEQQSLTAQAYFRQYLSLWDY
jgi:hypothetical protein